MFRLLTAGVLLFAAGSVLANEAANAANVMSVLEEDRLDAFRKAMSEGHQALPDDPNAAAENFAQALALIPDDPSALDGAAMAERLLADATLQGLRVELEASMAAADWTAALSLMDRMDALTPQAADADGRKRLEQLVAFEAALDRLLKRPERLEIPAGKRGARELLAAQVDGGERVSGKLERLRALLERGPPSRARLLLSSGRCRSVRMRPGGELGAVRGEAAFDVAPGEYVVIGLRPGHRESRATVRLEPGGTAHVAIDCDERI